MKRTKIDAKMIHDTIDHNDEIIKTERKAAKNAAKYKRYLAYCNRIKDAKKD